MNWLFAILITANIIGFNASRRTQTETEKQKVSTIMAIINLIFVAVIIIDMLIHIS